VIVVADTSPINYLTLIGHIEILPHFYGRVLIPPTVLEELQDAHTPPVVRAWLGQAPPWLEKRELIHSSDAALNFLDRGEREAHRRNLSVIGTLGVLRNAARAGLLNLPEALSKLQETSFYVAEDLIQSLLEEDGARLKQG
jgi:predicted nucleic acid-binding protein